MPRSGERQKAGGQAALRSDSCVCGCDLNFGYQRRNRSSRSSLRTLVLVCSKRWALCSVHTQERGGLLQELGFCESQFLKFGDFGAFKERLRSGAIEEFGQTGGGPGSASAGLRLTLKQANCWPIATVTHGIYVATILLCQCIKSCLQKRQVGRKI